jgi:hypothetical protein
LRINRSSEPSIIFPRIFPLGISFGVIDMLSGQITTKSFGSDFEFASSVSMSQETEYHADVNDGLEVRLGKTSYIDRLSSVSPSVRIVARALT